MQMICNKEFKGYVKWLFWLAFATIHI